jgi:hypothetical protein
LLRSLFVGVALVASALPAAAVPITYSERIEDLNYATFLDLFDTTRDLTRTRTSGGPADIEADDPTIVGENLLSENWGFSTFIPMSWQHVFPSGSAVDTYLQGKLTIEMIGVDADLPDFVFVDFFPVGILNVGGMDMPSTTILSTDGLPDPDALISFFLADGRLDVAILPLLFDLMTIRSSTLEVTYEPNTLEPTAVPEPATGLLLLGGVAAGAWRRRQARRRGER